MVTDRHTTTSTHYYSASRVSAPIKQTVIGRGFTLPRPFALQDVSVVPHMFKSGVLDHRAVGMPGESADAAAGARHRLRRRTGPSTDPANNVATLPWTPAPWAKAEMCQDRRNAVLAASLEKSCQDRHQYSRRDPLWFGAPTCARRDPLWPGCRPHCRLDRLWPAPPRAALTACSLAAARVAASTACVWLPPALPP